MADKKKVEVKETKVEVKTATYKVFVHCGQCARDIQTEFTEFQGAFLRAVHVAALVCCFEWCMPICRRYACRQTQEHAYDRSYCANLIIHCESLNMAHIYTGRG